jgi:uncharacterized membrane protein
MNCPKCGKELNDTAKFCDSCGTQVTSLPQQNAGQSYQEPPRASMPADNRAIFVLSYLGILFFLPLVSCPESKEGRFHANQGLLLLIAAVAGQIAVSILSAIILAISWWLWSLVSLLSAALYITLLVFMIMGMVSAGRGEMKPLPIIGEITLIK